MKRFNKILISLFVALVMMSNMSYAISYSICSMTKMKSCCCDDDNSVSNEVSIGSKACCIKEVKEISNSSVFDRIVKLSDSISFQLIFVPLDNCNLFSNLKNISLSQSFEEISPQSDIPIKNSVLII